MINDAPESFSQSLAHSAKRIARSRQWWWRWAPMGLILAIAGLFFTAMYLYQRFSGTESANTSATQPAREPARVSARETGSWRARGASTQSERGAETRPERGPRRGDSFIDAPGAGPRPIEIVKEGSDYRLVRHTAGTSRVPASPKRICALACADELLALGVKPVAHSVLDGWYPDYLTDELKDVPWIPSIYGGSTPNLEAIVAAHPDLIFTRSPDQQTYQQLSQIAPVVVLLDHSTFCRQRVLDVGTIIGRRRAAEARVAWYDAKVRAAREVLRDAMGDQTIAIFSIRIKSYNVFGRYHPDTAPVLYKDLELTPSNMPFEDLGHGLSGVALSPEMMLDLNLDYLLVAPAIEKGSYRTMTQLLDNPIWQRLPAVKKGHVLIINSYRQWRNDSGVLGRARAIDDVLNLVAPDSIQSVNAAADAALQRFGS